MADTGWVADIASENYSDINDVAINCRTLCQGKRGFSSLSRCSSNMSNSYVSCEIREKSGTKKQWKKNYYDISN